MKRPPVVAPFCGIRFNPDQVKDLSRVTAPPYDVISPELQKNLYERDPHNIVRLILGIQNPGDTERDDRYTRAAHFFHLWLREGILIREAIPSFYLYEQEFSVPFLERFRGRFKRRGFLALRRLEEFEGGKIRPHEKTLEEPKADRLLLMKACSANFSPIFSLYSDAEGHLTQLLRPHFEGTPMAELTDQDQVRHRLWRVSDAPLFKKADEILGGKKIFIADGHHRYETAIAYRDWMRGRSGTGSEEAPYHYVLMYFNEISDPGLVVLPTHRILQNWPGFDQEKFSSDLEAAFQLKKFPSDQKKQFLKDLQEGGREGKNVLGLLMVGDPTSYLLRLKSPMKERTMNTTILHRRIFHDLLKMSDPEQRDPRFVQFIQEIEEASAALADPKAQAVFLLNPPSMESLKRVFEAGEVLPPKSTYFYPKLLTGLVINQLTGC